MGLTIYQSITPRERNQVGENSLLCGLDRPYQIRKWFGVRRSTWLLALYMLAYFTYLIGGSLLFSAIERENEEELRLGISRRKADFIRHHPEVSFSELESLIKDISVHGVSPLEKGRNNSNWCFGQSFLFTVTLVTTIGYGHINPVTPLGKIVCIVYAILGIPFTLVFLSALVQRLLAPAFSLLSKLLTKLSNFDHLEVRLLHLGSMWVFSILTAFIIPSVAFWSLEPGWTFLDSVYFVFISLTTIGLGDYIPGDSDMHESYRNMYKTFVGLYLLTGMVLLSLTLSVYYDIPQLNLGLHLHRHKDILQTDTNDANNKNSEQSTATLVSHTPDAQNNEVSPRIDARETTETSMLVAK